MWRLVVRRRRQSVRLLLARRRVRLDLGDRLVVSRVLVDHRFRLFRRVLDFVRVRRRLFRLFLDLHHWFQRWLDVLLVVRFVRDRLFDFR